MEREILFRGKRVDNGEWVHGLLCQYHEEISAKIVPNDFGCFYDKMVWVVDPETVGRYIGLTDKNGKKIFEGDIIECDLERFIVEWDDEFAGFYLSDIYPDYQGCSTLSDISRDGCIIGNIHDNPELMERKE